MVLSLRLSAADAFCRYVEPRSLLRELVSAQVRQIKMADFVDKFREIVVDRLLKHVKSFENICCWVRLRSPNHKLEKMTVDAIALTL